MKLATFWKNLLLAPWKKTFEAHAPKSSLETFLTNTEGTTNK